jgi:hypothetical protein
MVQDDSHTVWSHDANDYTRQVQGSQQLWMLSCPR